MMIQNKSGQFINPAEEETLQAAAKLLSKKITVVGDNTYIAVAAPGTSQSSPLWRVKRVVSTGDDSVTTWADGDTNFDNVATDLTTLTYL